MDLMAELQCKKGSILEAEAGFGCKGGVYKHCLDMQGWCLEIQSSPGDGNCIKGNKKSFSCFISGKRLDKENVDLSLKGAGGLVTVD